MCGLVSSLSISSDGLSISTQTPRCHIYCNLNYFIRKSSFSHPVLLFQEYIDDLSLVFFYKFRIPLDSKEIQPVHPKGNQS